MFSLMLESILFYFYHFYLYLIPFIVCLLYIRNTKKEYKLPPGPKGWPFIGHVPDPHATPLLFNQLMTEWKDKFGYIVLFKRFGMNFVYVSDYKMAFKALTQTFPEELAGRPINSVDRLNVGNQNVISVTSSDPAWIETRKQVMIILRKVAEPQKMTNISNRAYELFATCIRKQKELLESDEIPIESFAYWFAHNIISTLLWQEPVEYDDPDYQNLFITHVNLLHTYSSLSSFDATKLNFLPHPNKQKMLKYSKQLTDRIEIQIQKRRENESYKLDPTFFIDYCLELQRRQKENDERDKFGDVILFKRLGTNFVYVSDYKLAFKAFTQTYPEELAGRPKNSVDRLNVGNQNVISVTSSDPAWIETRKQVMIILRKVAEPQKMTNISNRAYELFATCIRKQKELLEKDEFFIKTLSHWLGHNIIIMLLWQEPVEYDDPDYKDSCIALGNLKNNYGSLSSFDATKLNFLPHPDKQKMLKYSKQLTDRIEIHIQKRREDESYKLDPTFFIDYCLQLQNRKKEKDERLANLPALDDFYIANINLDLYIGGMEALANGIIWTIGLLASHPHTQEKIRKELIDMATTTGESFNPKWMDQLHYLKAFIHELMRTATFSPFSLLHRAVSDAKIGDYDIPRDTVVAINIYGIHHDPRYWKDPYEFVPERFLNEEGKFQLPKEGFMPFGLGRRTCVAERYTVKESHFIFTGRMCLDFQLVWSAKNKTSKMVEDLNNIYAINTEPFYVEFIPL